MILDLFGVTGRRGKDAVDLKVQRIVQGRIELECAWRFRAGVGTNLRLRSVKGLAKHEEIRLSDVAGMLMNSRTPGLPEPVLDVLDRVDSETVEAGVIDPEIVDRRHVGADVVRVRSKIIQAAEFSGFYLGRAVEVLNIAEVVKQRPDRRVGGVNVEGRRVLLCIVAEPQ